MNRSSHPTGLLLALPLLLIGYAPLSSAAPVAFEPAQGTYSAPDNQPNQPAASQEVASNAAGTTDKTLVLTPKKDSDKTFGVLVVNAKNEVIDVVEYTPGNTPPVVVPPGAKAYVQDDADDNKDKPEGTSTFG